MRPSNVLFFEDELGSGYWELIDFDLARECPQNGSVQVLLQSGGQYDMRPASLFERMPGDVVEWTPALDLQMASTAIFAARAP